MLHSAICDLLNIEYPIVLAGMGVVARGKLAAAVSDAGGLGVIGSWGCTAQDLRDDIKEVRSLTDRPFAVDLIFPEGTREHLTVTEERIKEIMGGRHLSSVTMAAIHYFAGILDELLEVVEAEKVPVIISGLGNPMENISFSPDYKPIIGSLIGTVGQARRLEASGVDFIIAQGYDAGGHTGTIGTFSLVPQVVDAVKVPVLAAGGVTDARGLVAALALGACGVVMGTRFIATHESSVHQTFREKLIEADDRATVISKSFSGKTLRGLKNRWTAEWANKPAEILPFPLQILISDALGRACVEGDLEYGCAPAGQGSGMIKEIENAGEVVRELVEGAEKMLEQGFPAGRKQA